MYTLIDKYEPFKDKWTKISNWEAVVHLKVQFVLTILNLKELYLIQIVLKMQINTSEVILKKNNTRFRRYE